MLRSTCSSPDAPLSTREGNKPNPFISFHPFEQHSRMSIRVLAMFHVPMPYNISHRQQAVLCSVYPLITPHRDSPHKVVAALVCPRRWRLLSPCVAPLPVRFRLFPSAQPHAMYACVQAFSVTSMQCRFSRTSHARSDECRTREKDRAYRRMEVDGVDIARCGLMLWEEDRRKVA